MANDKMLGFGNLSLGSRLKRLSDRLIQDVSTIYQAQDIPLNPSFFPLFNLLLQQGAMSVTEAAELLGVSHPAVSKIAKKMMDDGWLNKQVDPRDERRQQLFLTDQSGQLLEQIQPVWREIRGYLDDVMEKQEHPFLLALNDFEQRIEKEGFVQPVLDRLQTRQQVVDVEIIGWQPTLREHFKRLNESWLNEFFGGEMIDQDRQALNQPEGYYLSKGGYIWFARLNGDEEKITAASNKAVGEESHLDTVKTLSGDSRHIVGCVALARHSADRYEISKMGVENPIQGLGIGRKLLLAALDKAREQGAKEVYLESATKLERAIQLYRNMGFVEIPHPEGVSVYPRSDIYMTLTL
jgi:DNA-binding MarR family transcriptional regulator/predicted GNAT family N-acyltransferase